MIGTERERATQHSIISRYRRNSMEDETRRLNWVLREGLGKLMRLGVMGVEGAIGVWMGLLFWSVYIFRLGFAILAGACYIERR